MTTEDKIARLADDAERVERFPDGYDHDQVLSALLKLLRAYRAERLLREAAEYRLLSTSCDRAKANSLEAQAAELVDEGK